MNDLLLDSGVMERAYKFAKMIAASEFAPKGYKNQPENVLIAIQYGYEVGLKPMQAIQNIAVIGGRPSMWGDAILALVICQPDLETFNEYFEGEGENLTAVCEVVRVKRKVQSKFSVKDARTAKLWSKEGPWSTYPRRMLQMRARGFALRDSYPDVLKGLWVREVAQDTEEDTKPVRSINSKMKSIKPAIVEVTQDEPKAIELKTIDSEIATFKEHLEKATSLESLGVISEAIRDAEINEEQRKFLGAIYKARSDDLKYQNQSAPLFETDMPEFDDVSS